VQNPNCEIYFDLTGVSQTWNRKDINNYSSQW